MLRNNRIKQDKDMLKENGYKRIKLKRSYNYLNDWETATMIYTCKKEKETYEQVILDKSYSFDKVLRMVKEEIPEHRLLHTKNDVNEKGIVYNLILEKENQQYLGFFTYDVKNRILTKKVIPITGDGNG